MNNTHLKIYGIELAINEKKYEKFYTNISDIFSIWYQELQKYCRKIHFEKEYNILQKFLDFKYYFLIE